MSGKKVVTEDGALQIAGLVPEGAKFNRNTLFTEIYPYLPKEADAELSVYTAEILPGGHTDWHLHNGLALFIVLSGKIHIEFQDEITEYGPGDVYHEPIGVLHRGVNPDPENSFTCVGFTATSPGRNAVTGCKVPW